MHTRLAQELGLEVTGNAHIGDPANPLFQVDQVVIALDRSA